MSTLNTIVYNSDYTPLGLVYWKDAFDLVYGSKATVLEEYEQEAKTPSFTFKIPKAVVLKRYVNFRRSPRYSKKNVFVRDGFKCAYCGVSVNRDNAELEHVVPRSQGGKTTWENTVTSCHTCNNYKDNRTPEQANMAFRKGFRPYKPTQQQWIELLVKDRINE